MARKKGKRKASAGRHRGTGRAAADDGTSAAGPRPRTAFWIFLGVAALAALVFFGSFVTDSGAMIFGTDMIGEAYQSRAYAVQEVEAGRGLPGWNPFVQAGIPYLSTLPYPVYYPTSLLYFAIPLHRAIGWAFVLHLVLAGVLAYALAREFGFAPGAAAVAGVGYMFTGYIVSHLYAGQDGRMFAMQWAPALFLCVERGIRRRSPTWFLLLALVVVLQVFTPHVQITYFTAMGVGAYALFRLWTVRSESGTWRPALWLLGGFVGAYVLAAVITLVQNWPTLNMLEFSHRADRGYDYAASWAMPVQETLAMIWPEFQGFLDGYWGTNPFKLHTEYVGAVPLFLAALALLARRTARAWFFAGLAALALSFAWGAATPVHRLFYWTLPMIKSFRAPGMMFSVVALSTIVLAAMGAQALHDRRDALSDGGHLAWKVLGGLAALWVVLWFWVAASPAGFAGAWASLLYGSVQPERQAAAAAAMPAFARGLGLFAIYWVAALAIAWGAARRKVSPLVACALLAAVTLVDLWRVDRKFYDVIPIERVAEPDPAVRFLAARPEPYRALPLPGTYGPNDLMLFRVPTVTGLQKFRLTWWEDLVGADQRGLTDPRVWSLLDLKYLVSPRPIDAAELEPVHQGGGPAVYRWRGPADGAWLVYRARRRPEGPGISAVTATGFDPRGVALIEPDEAMPSLEDASPGSGTVRWLERDPDRLALEVDTPANGLLVLSEVYHPYWSASVGGEPAEVLKVDVALRGVPVPAGRHEVVLAFDDPFVNYGLWGSVAGLVLWAGLFGWARRRDRGAAREPAPTPADSTARA